MNLGIYPNITPRLQAKTNQPNYITKPNYKAANNATSFGGRIDETSRMVNNHLAVSTLGPHTKKLLNDISCRINDAINIITAGVKDGKMPDLKQWEELGLKVTKNNGKIYAELNNEAARAKNPKLPSQRLLCHMSINEIPYPFRIIEEENGKKTILDIYDIDHKDFKSLSEKNINTIEIVDWNINEGRKGTTVEKEANRILKSLSEPFLKYKGWKLPLEVS